MVTKDLWSRGTGQPGQVNIPENIMGSIRTAGFTEPPQGTINDIPNFQPYNFNEPRTGSINDIGRTMPGQGPGPAPGPYQSGSNTLMNRLLTPEVLAALGMGGLGYLSNRSNNSADARESQADRDFTGRENQLDREMQERLQRERILQDIMNGRSNAYGDKQAETFGRDKAYMDTFAMDPVAHQKFLFGAGATRVLAGNGAPTIDMNANGVQNVPDFSGVADQFLNDEALANNAARFYGAAGTLSDSAPPADLSKMGFGDIGSNLQSGMNQQIQGARSGRQQLFDKQLGVYNDEAGRVTAQAEAAQAAQAQRTAQPAAQPQQGGGPRPGESLQDYAKRNAATTSGMTNGIPNGYEVDPKTGQLKKKGGFWKKAGRIAAIAAPIVAAPFTGGATLALIGAGSGAASGALSGGGWKGALMGAGMGAIPGMGGTGSMANAAGRTGMQIAGQMGKNLLHNPSALIQMLMAARQQEQGPYSGMTPQVMA